jgi:uncharacterized membrane protein
VLRRPRFDGHLRPASFVAPGGPTLPVVGILLSLSIIAGATTTQLLVGAIAVVAGAVLYALAPPPARQDR